MTFQSKVHRTASESDSNDECEYLTKCRSNEFMSFRRRQQLHFACHPCCHPVCFRPFLPNLVPSHQCLLIIVYGFPNGEANHFPVSSRVRNDISTDKFFVGIMLPADVHDATHTLQEWTIYSTKSMFMSHNSFHTLLR